MAIYRLIRESVFAPEAIERMATAYEHALKVLQLSDRNDPISELVARKIIEIAEVGELDPDRLCQRALAALKSIGARKDVTGLPPKRPPAHRVSGDE